MATKEIRYVGGWRLTISHKKLLDGKHWNVIIGTKDGKRYAFSRHMRYEDALWRMNVLDPEECQHAPYDY